MFDNLSSGGFIKKIVATAIIASTVSGLVPVNIAGISSTQPANAGEVLDFLREVAKNGGNVYNMTNAGKIRQYWYASFDGNAIQRQFGSGGAGNSVLHQRCSENYSSRMRLSGADYNSFWWGGGRWVIVQSRFEGGSGNCYMRRLAR